jgi:hypothetical protein
MWKDATYLGMLDTEWLMRSYFKPAPKSLWDEMFLRHTREREELLDWDETRSKLKRTSSMETLRNAAPSPDLELSSSASQIQLELEVDANDAASDIVPLTKDKGKRKRDEIPEPWDDRVASPPPPSSYDTSASDDSDFESAPSRFWRVQAVNDVPSARRFTIGTSPGSSESDTRSVSPESSIDSVDSRWDLLETSSGGSSSDFEHLQKVK